MKDEIIKNLNEADYYISKAVEMIQDSKNYSQRDNYLKILDEALNDIKVVSSGIEIDEKLLKDPEALNRALKQDR